MPQCGRSGIDSYRGEARCEIGRWPYSLVRPLQELRDGKVTDLWDLPEDIQAHDDFFDGK